MFHISDSDGYALKRIAAQSRGMQRIHPPPQRRPRRVGRAGETEVTTDRTYGIITVKLEGATSPKKADWGQGEAQMYDAEGEKDGDPITVYNRSADEVNVGIPCLFAGDVLDVPFCYPMPGV